MKLSYSPSPLSSFPHLRSSLLVAGQVDLDWSQWTRCTCIRTQLMMRNSFEQSVIASPHNVRATDSEERYQHPKTSVVIRRLQSTANRQPLDSLASQVVKRQSLCFFSPRAAESFVVTQLQTARWPVPTCADILKPSIDYLTLDKRKRGGWVLGFEFLSFWLFPSSTKTKVWMCYR